MSRARRSAANQWEAPAESVRTSSVFVTTRRWGTGCARPVSRPPARRPRRSARRSGPQAGVGAHAPGAGHPGRSSALFHPRDPISVEALGVVQSAVITGMWMELADFITAALPRAGPPHRRGEERVPHGAGADECDQPARSRRVIDAGRSRGLTPREPVLSAVPGGHHATSNSPTMPCVKCGGPPSPPPTGRKQATT